MDNMLETLINYLNEKTDDERLEFIHDLDNYFCFYCGRKYTEEDRKMQYYCQCTNDE